MQRTVDSPLADADLPDPSRRSSTWPDPAWNQTERPLPSDSLAALFEAQVRVCADRIAVVDGNITLTYSELNARANGLAWRLRGLGVDEGALVAISLPRSWEMIVGLLAILKAGGAYVPLDPDYPRERIGFMLADTGATILLTNSALQSLIGGVEHLVILDGRNGFVEAESNPPARSTPESLAYVLYTSGSTGVPKGVMIPQIAVTRLVINTNFIQITSNDRVAHASNTSFDAATFEVWGALLNGARLVIIPKDELLSPSGLAALIAREKITALFLTTALFNEYATTEPGIFSGLANLIFGGEVVDPKAVARVLQIPSPPRLVNGYGPTETTTFAAWYEIPRSLVAEKGLSPIPIGRPLANTRIFILDGDLRPVPVGSTGEIHIEGVGLARGYLNQPELTQQKFVPNPFGPDGSRLYKSGDLGRWTRDGLIEYVGRTDNQVKIRGYRIELGEIETALRRCAGIRDGIVLVEEPTPGNKMLKAVVSTAYGSGTTSKQVRAELTEQLPAHMIPSSIVLMDALPLTANGKVDRRALASPPPTKPERPLSEREAGLLKIWLEVLGARAIGPCDDFLELGGNSLNAIQLVNRIERDFGQRFGAGEILRLGTIERVAHALVQGAAVRTPPEVPFPLPTRSGDLRYEATASQQQVAFFEKLSPGTRAYLTQSIVTFDGVLDIARLESSLQRLVDRHEHLRTIYRLEADGRLFGHVEPSCRVELPVNDLRGTPEVLLPGVFNQEIAFALEEGIDPQALPLIKWRLFRLSETKFKLLLVEHHYVHDGWSFRRLLSELAEVYRTGTDAQLPAPTQYRAYAQWQQAWLRSDDARTVANEWMNHLDGCSPVLDLPFAKPRPAETTLAGGQYRVTLAPAMADALVARARSFRLTLFQLMFGMFGLLLHRSTGRADFLLGTSAANRTLSAWETVLGMLVNIVPVRLKFEDGKSLLEMLSSCADSLEWSLDRAELPFAKVVEKVRPPRIANTLPLVQIHFSSHNALNRDFTFGDISWDVLEALPNGTSKFDLGVITIPLGPGKGIELLFEYGTDVLERDTIIKLAADYEMALSALLKTSEDVIEPRALCFPVATRYEGPQTVRSPQNSEQSGADPELEGRLREVWKSVLKAKDVSPTDNFFEIGGHSLLALRLVSEIERACGVSLRLSAIFQAPTIHEQAALLAGSVSTAPSTSVLTVQPVGGRPPLFFVAGWGGAIEPFFTLAAELGKDQPLHLLDLNAFTDTNTVPFAIETVAAGMIRDLRAFRAYGPYYLAGFSLGGRVVYEMARQLAAAGESVALLALLDCPAPGYPPRRSFPVRALHHLRYAIGLGPGGALGYVSERLKGLKKYMDPDAPMLEEMKEAFGHAVLTKEMESSARAYYHASRAFAPASFPGPMLLIRAAVRPVRPGARDDDPLQGWGSLVQGDVTVETLHCAHQEMLDRKNAPALAAILRGAIGALGTEARVRTSKRA